MTQLRNVVLAVFAVSLSMFACSDDDSGGSGPAAGGSTSSGGGTGGTGGSTSGGGTGGSSSGAAPSCTVVCEMVASKGCPDAADCASECPAVSEACRACVAKSANICDPQDCLQACSGGGPGDVDCTAAGDACKFNSDCSDGGKCNSATQRCFDGIASCIGTACSFDADCGDDEKCNSATNKCVAK